MSGETEPAAIGQRAQARPRFTGGRDQELLAAMAEPLGALEGPRFIRDSSVPAPGWYWTPHDAAGRVWLGRNLQAASRRLIELREARLQPHPDTNRGAPSPPPPQRPDRTGI